MTCRSDVNRRYSQWMDVVKPRYLNKAEMDKLPFQGKEACNHCFKKQELHCGACHESHDLCSSPRDILANPERYSANYHENNLWRLDHPTMHPVPGGDKDCGSSHVYKSDLISQNDNCDSCQYSRHYDADNRYFQTVDPPPSCYHPSDCRPKMDQQGDNYIGYQPPQPQTPKMEANDLQFKNFTYLPQTENQYIDPASMSVARGSVRECLVWRSHQPKHGKC